MSSQSKVVIKCLKAIQPIGEMYIGVIPCDELVYLSVVDVRRLRDDSNNREVEDYIGIQRRLDSKREKDLTQYVNLSDATFPNSIILSASSENVEYDERSGTLSITRVQDALKVLDGQHRIAGLANMASNDPFECIVTLYVDMDLEDQAIVFATINKEQRKVSSSLVSDLYAFAKSKSPQRTAHRIARSLNDRRDSPFFDKIKILGTANNTSTETITQSTFAKSLIAYISKNAQLDREYFKKNPSVSIDEFNPQKSTRLIFRELFLQPKGDLLIAQNLFNYFLAVQQRWPEAWDVLQPDIILNRSTGFVALMRFLYHVYLEKKDVSGVLGYDECLTVFKSIDLESEDFSKNRFVPGTSGQSALYHEFKALSGLA